MKYSIMLTLLGVQTGKSIDAPTQTDCEADNLADALCRIGTSLRGHFNEELLRLTAITIKEVTDG